MGAAASRIPVPIGGRPSADTRPQCFGRLPCSAFADPYLSDRAKIVLGALVCLALGESEVHATNLEICDACGWPTRKIRTVQRGLAELESRGYLTRDSIGPRFRFEFRLHRGRPAVIRMPGVSSSAPPAPVITEPVPEAVPTIRETQSELVFSEPVPAPPESAPMTPVSSPPMSPVTLPAPAPIEDRAKKEDSQKEEKKKPTYLPVSPSAPRANIFDAALARRCPSAPPEIVADDPILRAEMERRLRARSEVRPLVNDGE